MICLNGPRDRKPFQPLIVRLLILNMDDIRIEYMLNHIFYTVNSLRLSDANMRQQLSTIGSDNGLSPERRQAIIWTNAGILLIGTLGTKFNEILIEIYTFSFKNIHLKMSSGKWRPFCLGLNVLNKEIIIHIIAIVAQCSPACQGAQVCQRPNFCACADAQREGTNCDKCEYP